MDAPSMVQRSGDTLIVRSVVSGDTIFLENKDNEKEDLRSYAKCSSRSVTEESKEEIANAGNVSLPQCKIKRNYSCNSCAFFTQNPRYFLTHLRDIHGEKIIINECKLCLYASRHYQKLVRHMKMVHGSTVGIEEQLHNRKRQTSKDGRKRKSEDRSRNTIIKKNSFAEIDYTEIFPTFEEPQLDDSFDNPNLKCRICDFIALHKAQLSEHEEEEHGTNKIFRCEKCNYVTHLKARFSKHVKYHSMPMIKCMTCDFRTPYKWNLDRHMKNHGGSGPFKCVACNFTADIKQSLTVHEMNHHIPPVGNSCNLNIGKRKNKMGSTDALDDIYSENEEFSDNNNNNSSNNNKNNNENVDDCYVRMAKLDDGNEQPTDLSQKTYLQSSSNVFKKTNRPVPNLIPIQTTTNFSRNLSLREIAPLFFCDDKFFEGLQVKRETETPEKSPSSTSSLGICRKKNENFFDKLKETSATLVSQHENLTCACGHVSKCLSESLIHQKACSNAINGEKMCIPPPINLCSSRMSTRCQFCRHRCKSSTDLASHILKCAYAVHEHRSTLDQESLNIFEHENAPHPMENKVFVWNEIYGIKEEEDENTFTAEEKAEMDPIGIGYEDLRESIGRDNNDNGYFGVETAPGYGEVTKKMTAEEEATNSSLKKVYKCPHCSFWASTASRFHVHIVGHLNKKPFECSLCNYRSNWRWDITKHIRLKTIRDPSHKNAKVLMNDETGRRNYTKYNKYITLMKVTEEDGDPKLLKSGAMTPNQEASLAFLNDPRCKFSDTGPDSRIQSGNLLNYTANNSQLFNSTIDSHQGQVNTATNTKKKSIGDMNKPSSSEISQRNLEDLLLNDEVIKHDAMEKKTTYKCKKCSYRNPIREAVLSHVKEHYNEVDVKQTQRMPFGASTDFYMKNVLASMCLLPQSLPPLIQADDCQSNIASLGASSNKSCVQSQSLEQTHKIIDCTNNVKKTGGSIAAVIDHGETDEASSGVVTTSGTGVSGWRSPAPFRCGHCHQVSNWKHVIQRHCRLKHSGDIRIETIDRTSKNSSPEYFAIFPQSNSSGASSVVSNTNNAVIIADNVKNNRYKVSSAKKSAAYCDNFVGSNNNNIKIKGIASNIEENEFDEKFHVEEILDHVKKQCPVIQNLNFERFSRAREPCKDQIKYRDISNDIKQDVNDRKDEKKNWDIEISSGKKENIYADSVQNCNDGLKVLSFCKFCPARFVGGHDLQLHLQTHYASFPYRCNSCSYTASQESYLAAHSEVHSTSYNENTEKLLEIFTINPEHRRPGLTQICTPDTETIWIVNEFALSLEENASHSSNECFDNRKIFKTSPCLYCPFESNSSGELEIHMKQHYCVSKNENPKKCCHCDFSASDDDTLKDHIRLHFKRLFWPEKNLIKCYTAYNSLKLMVTQRGDDKSSLKELLYDSEIASKQKTEKIAKKSEVAIVLRKGEIVTKPVEE